MVSKENDELNSFNWYPGHIAKAERELKEKISQIDIIIELRDARIPKTSEHKELTEWAKNKPIITVLGKLDLADEKRLPESVIKANIKDPRSLKKLLSELEKASKPIEEKFKRKGIVNRPARVMVVGYPNVGKSSLINALAKNKKAKVQNKPGVTRQQQWIDMQGKINLKLLDTPGIIPAKFYSDDQALKLALCTCIAEKAFDEVLVARAAIKLVDRLYPDVIKNYYGLDELSLEDIAEKKSCKNKDELDLHRAAIMLINDFRDLKFGRLSLD